MNTIRVLFINSFFVLSIFLVSATSSANVPDCPVNPEWITTPSLPSEVKKSGSDGTSTFCDFYQFSSQTFLYLMSPANNNLRNFQVQSKFPLLEYNKDGNPENSCDRDISGMTLRTNLSKKTTSTGQAGSGAVIYAQDKNVICKIQSVPM